jgi:COP9 signalosome complex subunit 6
MAGQIENPLISSKPSDSGLSVSLHPLVLLTVSDQVTRHLVRKQQGPIAGALLGQQKGREITAEYAFPVVLVQNKEGQWQFNEEWMETRIQQCMVIRLLCMVRKS